MRAVMMLLCLSMAAPAFGEKIDEVLERSQISRLQSLPTVALDDPRSAIVRASFERLLAAGHRPPVAVELHVVEGSVVAECLFGRVVVANASLAEMPEGERLFVLSHELGHLINGDWADLGSAFRKYIPGDVVPGETDSLLLRFGPQMSALSHRYEYNADAYALRALQQLGFGLDSVLASFVRHGVRHDTATHPGTRKRVAHLRAIEKD